MGSAPQVRRVDKLMPEATVMETLRKGYAGRVATVGEDGWPYVCPLLYVCIGDEIWVHNTSASGHFRTNVMHQPRVCFELDEPGQVFPYGRFECDTSIEYRSVVAFGTIRIVNDDAGKTLFFDTLMQKYAPEDVGRPKAFYPRLNDVTVYAITIERITGKETRLPAAAERWPAVDNTRSPGATP